MKNFLRLLSNLCREFNVKQFIHLSALGIEQATDSLYAISKLNGEIQIKKNFKTFNYFKTKCYLLESMINFTT